MIKNYVKEMLNNTENRNSWAPELLEAAAVLSNIYKYGQHIEMTTLSKEGDLIKRDVTKEILSREGLIK